MIKLLVFKSIILKYKGLIIFSVVLANILFQYSIKCNAQIINDTVNSGTINKILNTKKPVTTIVKTNPYTPLWGPIPYTGEYRIIIESMTNSGQSLQFGAAYLGKSILLAMMEDSLYQQGQPRLSFTGYRIQGAYKFYFYNNKNNLEGMYIGPFISWSVADISYKQQRTFYNYLRITHFNANIILGYQFVFNNIALDAFCGLGYKKNVWYNHNTPYNYRIMDTEDLGLLYNSNLKLILGFNIGFAL